ncbi:hypothetical protein [Actinoallomurus iriomotensis]|uniref:Uncharacterized protein n=1 Tax=Actinoallomurus iriomotensis TaxID=478107 RepID=A0A9W6VSA5_9ACTN|nr:hypothetical protein [Actinoallomurus iriomotensis]GLY78485.1 hypothetical protein Airi01_067520 [Actinoallomurus iriomotensis]
MEQPSPSAERQALADLLGALHRRGVSAIAGVDDTGWPCLTVADSKLVTRRVNVNLSLWWFTWGNGHDERVSSHRVEDAADRIARVVEKGWPEQAAVDSGGYRSQALDEHTS